VCVCVNTLNFLWYLTTFSPVPSLFITKQLNALQHRQLQNKYCVTIQDPHGEPMHKLRYPDNQWCGYYIGSRAGLCTEATAAQKTRKRSLLVRNERRHLL
jgi:hypothetical protein